MGYKELRWSQARRGERGCERWLLRAGASEARVRGVSRASLGALRALVDAELHVVKEAADLLVQPLHGESGLRTRLQAGT